MKIARLLLASAAFLGVAAAAPIATTFTSLSSFIAAVGTVEVTPINQTKTLIYDYNFTFGNGGLLAVGITYDTSPAGWGSGWGFCLVRGTACDQVAYIGGDGNIYAGFIGFTSQTPFDAVRIYTEPRWNLGTYQETGTVFNLYTQGEPPRDSGATPEPSTVALLGVGAGALLALRRRYGIR